MTIEIRELQKIHYPHWDDYVNRHGDGTIYHLATWKDVIQKTYGHRTFYLMAWDTATNHVKGVLPLIHLKHIIFGNNLISIPFFDLGGVIADNTEAKGLLIDKAIELGQQLRARTIELRQSIPPRCLDEQKITARRLSHETKKQDVSETIRDHKHRMMLQLPESSEALMQSFKSKLRSQIKKPIKEGLTWKVGGIGLIEDFYKVFSVNMRDLGSPVHSKKLMKNVLEQFPGKAHLFIVYLTEKPVACSLIIGYRDILENPWASSLREYGRLSPNMLLYWAMLAYACENRYKWFDFGRSSPEDGTYKFKTQWGAKPYPLHWHYIWLKGRPENEEPSEKSKFEKAIQYWRKLPVPVTKIIGPAIRKHIGL